MWVLSKGYNLSDLTKREAAKAGLLEQLAPVTDVAALRAAVQEAQANKGVAFKVKHKKQVVGCLIFRREEASLAALIERHPDLAEHLTPKPDKKGNVPTDICVLRLVERYVLPEHDEAVAAIEHDENTLREAGLLVVAAEHVKDPLRKDGARIVDTRLTAVLWGDDCVTSKNVNVGNFSASGYLLGFGIGICFGAAISNLILGVSFGACFALLFGVVFSHGGNHTDDKQDDKNHQKDK